MNAYGLNVWERRTDGRTNGRVARSDPALEVNWNWNFYLFPLWCFGVVLRYCVLFPIRLTFIVLANLLFFSSFGVVHTLFKAGGPSPPVHSAPCPVCLPHTHTMHCCSTSESRNLVFFFCVFCVLCVFLTGGVWLL